jgi:hypothetical protein
MPSRRDFLAAAGATGAASLAGCASAPPGPTDEITYARTTRLNVPEVPPPAEPTDTHVLARRAHLDRLVTTAEPMFARASPAELGEGNFRDCAVGVASVRDWLEESAADPASMDFGFAVSRVSYAGYALGFLRSWYDRTTPTAALERVRDARDAIADATASMPRDCADPATYLARVAWAERRLHFAETAVDHRSADDVPETDSREREAAAVGRFYEDAARAEGFVLDARYYARAYRETRPDGTTDFADALARRRRALRARADGLAPERGAADRRADEYDDPAASAYVGRAHNPAGKGREQYRRASTHADAGRLALAAVAAGRAACHYAGYRRVLRSFDPDAIAGGPPASALFSAKRAVVRRVRDALAADDPLFAWLANEPARLLSAGEVYLDDTDVTSTAVGRAVCLSFFRHARGYAEALESVVETLETGDEAV